MIFSKLLDLLKKDYDIETISKEKDLGICNVALIDSRQNSFLDNTLYCGYDAQLQNLPNLPMQCILTHSPDCAKITHSEGNLAYTDGSSLFCIFNEVKSYIENDITSSLYDDLIDIADNTHTLNSVLDLASINLRQSLLLCDTTFKIISVSSSIPVTDPIWCENIKKGYCSYDFIQAVKALPSIKNSTASSAPIEVTCVNSPSRKLTQKVFLNGRQVGFLLMIESEKKFSDVHEELLSITCHAVEYTIKKYIPNLSEIISPHYRLMYDCIIGAPDKDIEARLDEIHFPGRMAALFLYDKNGIDNWYRRNLIVHKLKDIFIGTHVTYDQNGIIAVIPYSRPKIDNALTVSLDKFAHAQHIKIGISYPFNSIKHLYNHYQQSYKALTLGELFAPSKTVYFYENYQAYDLISRVNDKKSLENLLHPALLILKAYDKKNNTQLFKTLSTYIYNDCIMKETASELFIHRNTLSYRLNRITELCNIDYEDHHTRFLLKLSFLINDYCDRVD